MPAQKIAVLFVHGMEIDDAELVDKPIQLLRDCFAKKARRPADQALAIRAVLWGPEAHQQQETMFRRCLGAGAESFSREMTKLVEGVNAGSQLDLLQLLWRSPLPAPELGGLRFPALRWYFAHFGGDIVAYQVTGGDHALYDSIHMHVADALHDLADENEAGPEAPLCVISHSLGTVIASNYFYDLQNAGSNDSGPGRPVRDKIRDNPLEKGETLTFFHTLGSPLALWASSHVDTAEEKGKAITVPAPELRTHHPKLADIGQWVNFIDPDDIIAYPLAPLGDAYRNQVTDQFVDVGPFPAGVTPLSHISYWYDRKVMDSIAEVLAQAVETNV